MLDRSLLQLADARFTDAHDLADLLERLALEDTHLDSLTLTVGEFAEPGDKASELVSALGILHGQRSEGITEAVDHGLSFGGGIIN